MKHFEIQALVNGISFGQAILDEGRSLIIGSGEDCGLQIKHSSVSPRHSTLRLHEGVLTLSDWYSEAGTQVNGSAIEEEIKVTPSDLVQLGDAELQLTEVGQQQQQQQQPKPETDSNTSASVPQAVSAAEPVERSKNVLVEQLQKQIDELTEENRQLQDELEHQLALDAAAMPGELVSPPNSLEASELQEQVLRLETELAERERELDEISQSGGIGITDVSETEALVDRLEKLLGELGQADVRAAELEDLLRASDEAHDAEQEERRQINIWMDEIESRLSQREHEWQAKLDSVTQRTELAEAQLAKAQVDLGQAVRSQGNEQAEKLEQRVAELRSESRELAARLQEALEGNEALKQQLAKHESSEEGEIPVAFREYLRTKELELAQERAESARAKAALARLQDDATQPAAADSLGSSDIRVKALREHLREIHDEEKNKSAGKRDGRSLASRIASLWQRLDN